MSLAQPPLPPRRGVPPPPPPRRTSEITDPHTPSSEASSIAERIANLRLDHVGRASPGSNSPPQPSTNRPNVSINKKNRSAQSERDAHLIRLLSRRPPPIPGQATPPAPGIPKRRLPPTLPPLPTPPPEPEYEIESVQEDMDGIEQESYQEGAYFPESCIKCRDFSQVDAHAALFPRHTISSLDQLAFDLTEPFSSETEKSRAIFTWLHHNITYDCAAFFSGNLRPSTPESTLKSGLAVCEGYAGLFKSLAERVGLQVHCVSGHGKGFGYVSPQAGASVPPPQSNHAWNCVMMDEEWHLIDSCWGAGALEGSSYKKRFSPLWFSSTPEEFGKRHFPMEDPSWQLLPEENQLSWEEYIMQPDGPIIFDDFYQLDLHTEYIFPAVKNVKGGTRVLFRVFKRCQHMSTAEEDNYVFILINGNDPPTPLALDADGGWSAEINVSRGGGEVSLMSVKEVSGGSGFGLGLRAFRQAQGRKAMAYAGLLRWSVI